MLAKHKSWFAFVLALLAFLPKVAQADIAIGFHAHEFGSSFPHALITVRGAPHAGGPVIDTNYGFTAKSVTPSLLFGSVAGKVESMGASYVRSSPLKFTVIVSDAQYAAAMAVVAKWRDAPGKSYNLNRHNCVHFVGEVAQSIGLKVIFEQSLIKKPRSFLENIIRLNPQLHEENNGK